MLKIGRFVFKVFVVCMLFCGFANACKFENHYTRKAKIVNVDSDIVTVVDNKTGNIWEFKGDGYITGKDVKLTFFTNNTDNLHDDEIIKAVMIERQRLGNLHKMIPEKLCKLPLLLVKTGSCRLTPSHRQDGTMHNNCHFST